MNKGWTPYSGNTVDAAHFIVIINEVILNYSCRDMEVRASCIKSLRKIGAMK